MHEPQLSLAALPEPPRLFRLRLQPYSLGHELHLWRRASPLLTLTYTELRQMERGKRLAAVMQAVHVCHQDFHANCQPMRNWRLWLWLARFHDLNETLDKLLLHIQAGHEQFRADLPSGPGIKTRPIGAPALLRLYQFVCANVPEREIAFYCRDRLSTWNYPMALASMLMQARSEEEGNLSIYNFTDQQRDDYVAEMDALDAKGELKWPSVPTVTQHA